MKRSIPLIALISLAIGCGSLAKTVGPQSAQTTTASTERQSDATTPKGFEEPLTAPEKVEVIITDAEIINQAIEAGDCLALYKYLQRDKNQADPKLTALAAAGLKKYTALDSWPPKYRTGKMDPRIRRIPKETMEKVFATPESALPDVVTSLTTGVMDNFMKVKILHDWICDNIAYDTDMYFSARSPSRQDYASVLKKRKAVCSGYAGLFNKMCELAGIESIGIQGYSKGFGYTGKIGKDTDHEWNAVRIGNKWYLIDVTWDAGHVDRRTFIKRYSTEWLFLDSRPFLYSHLPQTERLQFHAPTLTAEDFMREPYIKGKFFQYGLAFKNDNPHYDNRIAGDLTFDLVAQNSSVLFSSVLRTVNQRDIEAASWVDRKGLIANFTFDVPDSDDYKGIIFARYVSEIRFQDRIDIGTFENDWLPRTERLFSPTDIKDRKITETELRYFKASYFKVQENGSYYFLEDQFDTLRNAAVLKIHRLLENSLQWSESVLDFKIRAAPGYGGFGKESLKFPHAFSTYHEALNTRLVAPITGALEAGKTATLRLISKDFSRLAVIIDGKFFHFIKNSQTGDFELTLEISSNIDSLTISGARGANTQYWGLVRYEVIP